MASSIAMHLQQSAIRDNIPYMLVALKIKVSASTCTQCYACIWTGFIFSLFYRHHAWVSFEAAAEVYNEFNRATRNYNTECFKEYLHHNRHDEGTYMLFMHYTCK